MPYNIKQYKETADIKCGKIKERIYTKLNELSLTAYVTDEPVPFEERTSGKKIEMHKGELWGKLWDCAWIHCTGVIPKEAKGECVVALIDIHGELCVFDDEGNPIQGLTSGSSAYSIPESSPAKREVVLAEKAEGGEKFDFWMDAGCNDLFGAFPRVGEVEQMELAVCRRDIKELYYDWMVLNDLMKELPEGSAHKHKILFCLEKAALVLQDYTFDEVKEARAILAKELSRKNGDVPFSVSAIGHAHIDLAWLWPIRETIRKGARTFSTALRLMEKYPDYVFGASQPQLYQWMKTYYPKLYKQVADRVSEGRWEAQGAMWVEADTNVSGGEALVRQVLYGKKFFREEFGKDMEILWLPDVFGYTGALPQILKKSGTNYFMTIKLSWSRHNTHPHHTFRWQGIDGSEVFVHMPPEGNYNSSVKPMRLLETEQRYVDKGISDEALALFGIGDGGGGPGEENLEYLKREKNLLNLPPVKQEPAIDFFHRLEKNSDNVKTFKGELYLEKHQGTYTTQARNKKYNRKMEFMLREVELASVLSGNKPGEELEKIWKEVLLYQFHDILPGSSIKRVYDESLERYASIYERCGELLKERYGDGNYAMNSTSWERREWIKKDNVWYDVTMPPMGSAELTEGVPSEECETENTNVLENDLIRVTLDLTGAIVSVFDKDAGRELLSAPSNRFTIYGDEGDCWDFDEEYRSQTPKYFTLKSAKCSKDGPKKMITQTYKFGKSTIVQEISVTDGSPLVVCKVKADWKESMKMLRTAFFTNIVTDRVTCDIQFGNIKRSVLQNTSLDMAQYEICAHKYIDLSEADYGAALLSESKYGYYAKDGVMDINLLRSPSYPGEMADVAEHEFSYAFYPHAGNLEHSDVAAKSYAFNIPVQFTDKYYSSFVTVSSPNVVVETVKPAENDDAVVVRLYEYRGEPAQTSLQFAKPVKRACIVDMMEENEKPVDLSNVEFHPFEINTLKLYF